VRVVLATRNEHKLRELTELMRPHELEPLPDDVQLPPETGTTFADNALGKARAAAAATGRAAIADDSGIEAAALRGAPGVWSARYAGDDASDADNLAKLLREVPPDGDTRVRYVCAMAFVEPGGAQEVVHGRCTGRLTHEPRGSGGFGYDPAFVPDDHPGDRTMAELSPREKDAISHRGHAARELAIRLARAEERAHPPGPLADLFRSLSRRRT
jgi:XTP/dITP diphosphohydrolase